MLQVIRVKLYLPNGQYSLLPTARDPRMVTCELSRVCWLRRNQHNRQHMQITRRRGKACQEPRRP